MDKAGSGSLLSLFLSSLLVIGPTDLESIGLVCGEALPNILNEIADTYEPVTKKRRRSFASSYIEEDMLIKIVLKYTSGVFLSEKRGAMIFAPFLKEYCVVTNWGFGRNVNCKIGDNFSLKGKVFLFWGSLENWKLSINGYKKLSGTKK